MATHPTVHRILLENIMLNKYPQLMQSMFYLLSAEHLLKEADTAISRNVYLAARMLKAAVDKPGISVELVCC